MCATRIATLTATALLITGLSFDCRMASAQDTASPPLPPLPQVLFTVEHPIRVTALTTELENPWSIAFLPDGAMLVTERPGRLRLVRNGELVPAPIDGVPAVRTTVLGGLLDVALHPAFADNRWVYLSYSKGRDGGEATTALARGRFEGDRLTGVEDIFVANSWSTSPFNFGGRIAFDRDGFLFLAVGERMEQERAQDGRDHGGKVLRLRDDGSVPEDNPFVGREDFAPEVYSLGHRSPQGLALNPGTGEIWEHEHGPLGGDEINILRPGGNYGWPLVTYGRDYEGGVITEETARPELEPPFMYWLPSIAPSGLSFYTGDRFPAWRGNAFVGAMMAGRIRATGHIQRLTFNDSGLPIQREPILFELRQRIRDVRPGPDGLLYVLTDENPGALLRIEPAD
jgi:aldose sugar dehydrogenase